MCLFKIQNGERDYSDKKLLYSYSVQESMKGVRQFLKKTSPNTQTSFILLGLFLMPFITPSFAQSSLNVTESVPCFMNFTSTGLEMMQNCRLGDDYISAATVGFDWVSGGLWPLVVVSILIIMTYVKYQNGIYPLAIGVVFLPIAGNFFPDEFVSMAVVIGAVIAAGALITMLIKQTRDTS